MSEIDNTLDAVIIRPPEINSQGELLAEVAQRMSERRLWLNEACCRNPSSTFLMQIGCDVVNMVTDQNLLLPAINMPMQFSDPLTDIQRQEPSLYMRVLMS